MNGMKDKMKKSIPQYSADLIGLLNKEYPKKCLKPNQNKEEALFYAGKRDLIDSLILKITKQREELNVIEY